VDTRVLRFYWLLCCCAGSALGATCCWLPLLHLMEARLEFVSPAAGCIIALALRTTSPGLLAPTACRGRNDGHREKRRYDDRDGHHDDRPESSRAGNFVDAD
jgi:hypothetical protein